MVTSPFFTFAIVLVIAFAMPVLALAIPRLRLPTAILEIACGVLVGASGLRIVLPPDWLQAVTRIGLLYLMFLAGLEIRLPTRKLENQVTSTHAGVTLPLFYGAVVSLALTVALALAASHSLAHFDITKNPNLTALILSTTSIGVVVPILKESGQIDRPFGQLLLLSALLADFSTVFAASFVLQSHAGQKGSLAMQLLVLSVLAILLYTGGKVVLRRLNLRQRIVRVSQLGVRGALAIMAICGATALWLHAEVILGGFVGGLVCSLLAEEKHEVLREKLEIVGYSLFLPLFFVTVGMELDLSHVNFASVLTNLPLYAGIAFLVKMGAATAFFPFLSRRQTAAAGVLMSTRFTLVVAVATLAAREGIIGGTEEGLLIATAMVTVLLAPPIFSLLQHQDRPIAS